MEDRKVKMTQSYTPLSSRAGVTRYAGSEYTLTAADAQEVVDKGYGDYVVEGEDEVKATDAAKREAAKEAVDLTGVKATGSDGQVTVGDVKEEAAKKK